MKIKTAFLCFMCIALQTSFAQRDSLFLPNSALKASFDFNAKVLLQEKGLYQFEWLDENIKNNKVLFLGESHWMTGINKILTDLVLYANTKDYFPTLVLEIPFSATAFVNEYLQADSNYEAQLLPLIQPFFKAKESMRFLHTLKIWNQKHPNKKINIACSDFEQGFLYSLQNVLNPYFKACGHDSLMPIVMKAKDVTPAIFSYMDSVIVNSPVNTTASTFAFINNDYVKKVWANFRASYNANRAMNKDGYDAFLKIRVERIYKNLTDDFFFGKQLKEGKTILWGGAEHAKVYDGKESSDTLRMEGWQLAHTFAPTKGKVFSIKVANLAYNLPPQYYISDSYKRGTNGFVHLVEIYKNDVPSFTANRFRIINSLTPFSRTLVAKSSQNENKPLYFSRDNLIKASRTAPKLKQDEFWQEGKCFNAEIVLPCSPLYDFTK